MDRILDGNAAAGVLGEIFPYDMTMVTTVCSTCGAADRMAELMVFMDAPGLVMRCGHCETVLLRLVDGGDRIWLDLRGAVCLQIDRAAG